MNRMIDFFNTPAKAAIVWYVWLTALVLFLAVWLMYAFPAYLYIAFPRIHIPLPDWHKITVTHVITGLCVFSMIVAILARKKSV